MTDHKATAERTRLNHIRRLYEQNAILVDALQLERAYRRRQQEEYNRIIASRFWWVFDFIRRGSAEV